MNSAVTAVSRSSMADDPSNGALRSMDRCALWRSAVDLALRMRRLCEMRRLPDMVSRGWRHFLSLTISGLAASFQFLTRLPQTAHRFGRSIRRAGTSRRKFAPLSMNCWTLGDQRRPGINKTISHGRAARLGLRGLDHGVMLRCHAHPAG